MFRKDIVTRITAVEREHRVAQFAIASLLQRSAADPTILADQNLSNADARSCRENIEKTYFVRIFAVFEEGLRDIRKTLYGKRGAIMTYDLVQQCASRQRVPHDQLRKAHAVREYRNAIVHGGAAAPVPLSLANTWLCLFFNRMPREW